MKVLIPKKIYLSKAVFLFYFLSMISLSMIAQDSVVITGASKIKIVDSTTLFINGSIINEDGSILNSGEIHLNGNIVNNDSDSLFLTTTIPGLIRFTGDSIQRISGNPIFIYKVLMQKTDSILLLETNIGVKDTIIFENGIIDLNGNILHLENYDISNHGTLGQESDTSRVTGESGYVYTNTNFTEFMLRNGAGMGLYISGSPTGNVSVQRGHTSQVTVTDGSIKKYYNVFAGTAGQNAGVEVHYLDSTDFKGVNCSEEDFKIFTSHTQGYYFENKYGEVNTANDSAYTTATENIALGNDIRITVADHICDNPPIVNIGDTLHICAGSSGYLNAANTGCYFYWSTGQTTQSISVVNPGWCFVTVTDPYRCFSIDSIWIIHDSIPHPSFNTASGLSFNCVGDSFNFVNNTTSDASTLPLTYLWEFGDGTTSTDFNPTKTYLASGTYTVTLTAYTFQACQSYSTKTLTVNPLPIVSFTASNSCDYNPVVFANTTPNTLSCSWDFGDGTSTSSVPNPLHQYSNYGSYTAQLIVTSNAGCVDSLSKIVNVYSAPIANFSIEDANICLQQASVFHNSSTSNDGSLTYNWNFGNGQSNSTPNPIITYTAAGDYNVTLIVQSQHFCSDTIIKTVTISPLPQANFTYTDVCDGDVVGFLNTSTISGGESLDYLWSFGDGNTSNSINANNLYSSEGTYTVILSVTSASGCVANTQKNIHVYPIPSVDFICHPVCNGVASTFTNYSTCGTGNLNYEWDFGDASSLSSDVNPAHLYSSAGIFASSLIAISDFGCSDTLYKNVEVYSVPSVDIGDEINHCFNTYQINAGNPGCTFHWSNNAISQSITVNTAGTYSVTVTNGHNCSSSDAVIIHLNTPVTINLGGNSLETCDSIVLNTGYPLAETQWSTGSTEPTLTVFQSGTYTVSITNQGCLGDTTVYVEVYISPEIELGSDITVCEGETVYLNAGIVLPNYLWSDNQTTQQISVNSDGQYGLTVTDSHGCTTSDDISVEFNPLPILPFGSDTVVCGAIILNALNLGSQYSWNNLSTSQTLSVNESGEYWVNIIAGSNCSLSDTIFVTVNPIPELNLGIDTALCVGEIFEISAGEGFESYLWNNLSVSPSVFVVETGEYWVKVSNQYSCFSSDTINVVFNNNPVLNLGPDLNLCSNQYGILDAGNDGTEYIWESSFGFMSTETGQIVMVSDSGMYWVRVINDFGCSSYDSITLRYSNNSINAYFLAASEAERGDSIRFVDVSSPTPISYLWAFGDGVISSDSLPTHVYYLEGVFNVVLSVSSRMCTDTVSKFITISGTSKKFIPEDVEIAPTNALIEVVSSSLYPNPTNGVCYYELQLNRHTLVVLDLYSISGQLLYSEHIQNASYVFKTLDMQNLMPGMYILRMRYSDKNETYKIIKE